jgi:phosphate transport system permease protein
VSARVRERAGLALVVLAAVLVLALTLALLGALLGKGGPALSWSLLSEGPRKGMTEGGILPAIFGTVLVTFVTALLTVPVGVGAALWLVAYAPRGAMVRLVRFSIRNLAGVPSVVFGLFGVALFVRGLHLGLGVLSSGLTLGLLTLPIVITASEEALRRVPLAQIEAALALGSTRWEALARVVLPQAAAGILTGCILALSRAAGETAPLLFTGVAYSRPGLPGSLFDRFMALPYHLYVLATQHHDLDAVRPIAYATALVLLALVIVCAGAAALLRARLRVESS